MDANTRRWRVAALTGVSVRTLHHYDHIGLVVGELPYRGGYAATPMPTSAAQFRAGVPVGRMRSTRSARFRSIRVRMLLNTCAPAPLLLEQADRDSNDQGSGGTDDAHRDGIQLSGRNRSRSSAHRVRIGVRAEAEERGG